MKVCVYAICKDESAFVDRWMDSMGESDTVVVTDTGSQDDTVERLRKRGAVVHIQSVKPWRFDMARNISLGYVPDDVDICVCTDLDEVFLVGWRAKLEDAWLGHQPLHEGPIAKTGRYLYNWSVEPDGRPGTQFHNFKIHERNGFRWRCPVHEYLEYIGPYPLETVYIPGVVLNHYPDKTKPRGSYLDLLLFAVKEAPQDARMRYYLGRERMYRGQWQECVDTLLHYLKMPNAKWAEERCAAMRWIAKASHKLGRTQEAYRWYYRAIGEAPGSRDPYVEFSMLCCELGDWSMTYCMAHEALKIGQRSKTFVNMGHAWNATPDDLCAVSAHYLGMREKALHHIKRALEYSPGNPRLLNNLKIIQGT